MQRDDILALAARVEAGTAEQQSELLYEASTALAQHRPHNEGIFAAMVAVGAYESAAMLLVPEGWEWSVTYNGYAEMRHPRMRRLDQLGRATAPAFALTAASLRAIAEGMEDPTP